LGIGDWAQSPIPNPQSPIPNPQILKLKYDFDFLFLNKRTKYLYMIILKMILVKWRCKKFFLKIV
jgi:hypothetical protein